jgi:hypothetical protein
VATLFGIAISGTGCSGFPKRSCSIKELKRVDDSTESDRALDGCGTASEPGGVPVHASKYLLCIDKIKVVRNSLLKRRQGATSAAPAI